MFVDNLNAHIHAITTNAEAGHLILSHLAALKGAYPAAEMSESYYYF